ncbi:MAG TPA: HlyD family secretion protein [Bryobacteraceae bacterium]|nr:HlyD family secretion protein [Bryobacteraceae bacterium]
MQPATEPKKPMNLVSAEGAQAAEVSPPPQSAPGSRAKFILLFVFLIAAAAGVAVWLHYQNRVSTDDATVDGHLSAIAPKISGNVIQVLIQDNQPVKAGDVLVRIDPRDYQAKVDLAQAALLEAQARAVAAQQVVPLTNDTTESAIAAATAGLADANAELERARLSYEQANSADLAYAEANVQAKQASNDRAQADLARMKPLVEKSEISSLQFDSYNAAARVAASELKAAQEKLASAQKDAAIRRTALDAAQSRVSSAKAQMETTVANRKQVPIRRSDAGSASAAVAAARANLEAAQLQLSYSTITAPVDGVITRKSVEMGQMVAPGQSLLTIIPLNDIFVTANFKETQLADVRAGQRAEIHVDMYGRSVSGRVDSIASATGARLSLLPPENATGNFVKVVQRIPVKILVDPGANLILRPGMNVDVTIFTK